MATKPTPKPGTPEYMAMLGSRGGKSTARRKGKSYFSRIAKLSHKKNNPAAKRKTYNGGRHPNVVDPQGTE